MAGEEDVELRDLVAQTLEAKGVLGKIRAELRASVFLALEEQEAEQQKPHPLVNQKLQQYLKTKDGQVAAALVREFLEFFNLDFTAAVFDPESNVMESYPGRNRLAKDLGIDANSTPSTPLLGSVVQKASTTPQPVTAAPQLDAHNTTTQANSTSIASTTSSHPTSSTQQQLTSLLATTSEQPQSNSLEKEGTTHSLITSTGFNGQRNTNENSNLKSFPPMTVLNPDVVGNVNRLTPSEVEKTALVDLSLESIPGIHAELGETFVDNSSLDMDHLLSQSGEEDGGDGGSKVVNGRGKATSELERPLLQFDSGNKPGVGLSSLKDAPSLSLPSGGFASLNLDDKLKQFGLDNLEQSQSDDDDDSVSEDISLPTTASMASAKLETEDVSISQSSLPGDFDHTEPIQT